MPLQLDASVEHLIEQRVASGRYQDGNEAIRDAFEALDAREQFRSLRASIAEGFAQIERGEGVEPTDELLDRRDAEADEQERRGEPLNPDVLP